MTSRTTGMKIYIAILCCMALALLVIMPALNAGAPVYAQGGTVTPVISATVTTAATTGATVAATAAATVAATTAVTSAATVSPSATSAVTRTAPTTLPTTGQSGPADNNWILPLAVLLLLVVLGVGYALSRPSGTTR